MNLSKVCPCGLWISGTTEKQVDYNMKIHRAGKRHKRQIEAIKKEKR